MSRVLKWPAQVGAPFSLPIHPNSAIAHVGRQGGDVGDFCVWTVDRLLDEDARSETGWRREFIAVGTGHEVVQNAIHIASWQDPPFVWHLFELPG